MKKQEGSKWYRIWMRCALLALVSSVSLFCVMLQMEKAALKDYEKGTVWVAAKEIPRGLMLDGDNFREYLEQRQIEKTMIPPAVITDKEVLAGMAAVYSIDPGTILTEGMFEQLPEVLNQLEAPVVAGFKVEDLYQMVGGVLRPGDRIHIFSLNEDGAVKLVWENLYVQQVFDNNGNSVETNDRTTAVSRINIYISKEDVEEFYAGLAAGSLRVVRAYG